MGVSELVFKIYPYPSHYIYDIVIIIMTLLMARQLFNLTLTRVKIIQFTLLMVFFYQLNFLVIVPLWGKGPKYAVLYIGFMLGYTLIARLKTIAAVIVVLSMTAFNGLWTNINLFFMLQFLYSNYAEALADKHVQYTCYFVSVILLNSLTLLLRIKILDIQKYS